MKIKQSLLAKYVLAVLGVLLVGFLVMIATVQVATGVFINGYIENNVYVQQERVGTSLDQIVSESISIYIRMFTSENVNAMTSGLTPDKEAYYVTMYEEALVNEELFGGMTTVIDGVAYSNTDTPMLITSSMIDKVTQSSNRVDYCDTYIDSDIEYVILGKKVTDPSTPTTVVGTTFFYLRHSVLINIIENISGDKGYSFLVNDESKVVAHQDATLAGATLFDTSVYSFSDTSNYQIKQMSGEKSLVSVTKLAALTDSYNFTWHIVTIQSYAAVFSTLTDLQLILMAVAIVILAFSAFLAVRMSRKLISPIKSLSQKLENFDLNEPHKTTIQPDVHDELYQLEKTYDEMVAHIYDLLQKNKDDAEYQRKLELDSLQMQINPHFLYNTLDAIAWMAKIKKQTEIEHLVLALARFFRISLHKGDKFITVEEELELIKYFVEIELFRFPDKFSITYHITDEVKHYQVLKLIVQPIVENAIKHGISSLERMGNITINAYLKDNEIYIEVIDDGVGFNPPSDLLEKSPDKQRAKGGYGLINVNERIRLEYGPGYGLSVESTPEKGTKVTIKTAARI